jgi:predicted short-subunit dehydrogenase-like oxidoreductase (DUF2520 family)
MIKVVLIGAGNLAMNFQKIFDVSSGVDLIQWYSRKLNKIRSFKNKISITDKISDLIPADIYLIAVSDDAIVKMSSKIKTSALVVHCSGSIAIDELLCDAKKGVLYPIQTFSNKPLATFNKLPFLIETENKNDFRLLQDLVLKIGGKPIEMNSQKRSYIHLIAVIINNFGNHLIELGENIAQKHGIPFAIFHKIIEETQKNAIEIGARNSQTGPAKRKDNKTINKHLDLLSDEGIKKIYLDLTDSIKNRHE